MNKSEKKLTLTGTDFTSKNPLIIAELGTSHNGDIYKAKEMIDAAAGAGAGCVKFQIVYADEILHPNTGDVPLPGGMIRLYDRFKALELEPEFYQQIKEYSESKGLLFLCTPFGLKSASILKKLQPKIVKIASPELNFTALLEEIALWGLPVLLSSGVSRLSDIETAIDIIKKEFSQRRIEPSVRGAEDAKEKKVEEIQPPSSICLLHCVTAYPAPETDYNLRVLSGLASIFGVPVGVSDHSSDPELVPALSVGLGAVAVEKHFCLSKSDPGLDDPIALEPDSFAKMVNTIQQAAKDGFEKTAERCGREKGAELVERILGSGVKELASSEKDNYTRTNRSIHALRDIKAGEILKKCDYAVLRTEKILRPGLEPLWESAIEGRTAKNFIPAGEGIRFEDI
ncbi:MAG: N-acetylneuraminate synthase family protein [Treponema sp.]|nr:N-acetylneuraminate synthase family protein [Treponema sp.]